jgi:Nitrogen regulatory protein PII
MKMIRAIIRPESAEDVAEALAAAGFFSLTKISVFGRGKQKGITMGTIHYDELPKIMLVMVTEDGDAQKIVEIVKARAHTGSYGDGKIFISPVDDVVTVRTGAHEL